MYATDDSLGFKTFAEPKSQRQTTPVAGSNKTFCGFISLHYLSCKNKTIKM
jgi:hypothetical protein